MIRNILLTVLISSFMLTNVIASETKTLTKSWPEPSACIHCLELHFSNLSELYFSFPSDTIKSMTMLNIDGIAFSSQFRSDKLGPDAEIIFSLLNEDKVTGGMSTHGSYEAIGVDNLSGFFGALHDKTIVSQKVMLARTIMGVNDALSFIEYKTPSLSAYWIASTDESNQFLYILLNGSDLAIQIGGPLSSQLIEQLLAAIRVAIKTS